MGDSSENVALIMLAVFATAKLLAEICERLKQPGILGEIVAGILLGPAILNWVRPDQLLNTLADLGVMFLLFRIGLEVRPRELLEVGRTSLLVALLGVILPFAMGWGVMNLWHVSRTESAFVAAALVATSVGITAQVLSARGLLEARASRVILAAAVIDDVLGFMVLALVSDMARNQTNWRDIFLGALLAIVFTTVVIVWGPRTATRVFPHVEQGFRVGEVQFNLAMVTLFGLALLATYSGVAAIIGAFLAGMALSEVLETRVHTLSQGVAELLTPFFLISIGLHLDLSTLINIRTLVLVAVLTVIAVISKLAGCGLGAMKLGRADAIRVGTGMVPRGEVGMIVAQIGLRMQVISADVYAAVVMVAILTTIAAPVMLALSFRGVPNARRPDALEELSIT